MSFAGAIRLARVATRAAARGTLRRIELVSLIRLAASVIAPPHCAVCAAPCAATAAACPRCVAALDRRFAGSGRAGPIQVAWAAPYEGPARELVAALKFQGRLGLARLAGAAVARAVVRADLGVGGRAVVPVPAAPLRRLWRGFDPGELIAAALAAELGAPLARCLARRSGRRQVGRARAARLADAPRIRAAGEVPCRALLVDDVLTTGATIHACAAALRAAGCADIVAAVFARTLGGASHGA